MQLVPPFFTVQVAFAPLPLPFMQALAEIEIETSVDQASILRLHFDLSRTAIGDWDVLQFDIFRPLVPVRVMVALGLPVPQTIVNAYVNDGQLDNSNTPGASRYNVVALDATATLMRHIQQPMTWPNMADSLIATTIFGKYGIIPSVIPTPPTRTMLDTTSNQRMTDSRYLKQLAERNAYECYVQPDPLIGLDMGHFHPPLSMVPPQGVLSGDFGIETNLLSFSVSNEMLQPRSQIGVSVDSRIKAPIPTPAVAAIEPPMGLEPTLFRILPPPIERPAGTNSANPAEAFLRAQARVNESSRAVRANGEVDGLRYGKVLRPGLPVAVRGAGRQYSGIYYVTQVTHTISRSGYTQRFSAWRNAVGLTGAELFVDPMAAIA